MSEKYVVNGARLKCSACHDKNHTVPLEVLGERRIKINGKYVANKSDVFSENIGDFGKCKNLSPLEDCPRMNRIMNNAMRPEGISAELFDQEVARDLKPCVREGSRGDGGIGSLTPWLDCKEDVMVAGHPAVVESSYIMCVAGGGTITVVDSGQDE